MVHDWMLGPLPEGKHAIAEIIDLIRGGGQYHLR